MTSASHTEGRQFDPGQVYHLLDDWGGDQLQSQCEHKTQIATFDNFITCKPCAPCLPLAKPLVAKCLHKRPPTWFPVGGWGRTSSFPPTYFHKPIDNANMRFFSFHLCYSTKCIGRHKKALLHTTQNWSKGCSGNWTRDLSHPKRESCH